ncbi:MAG: hypothetical protein PHW72_01935 [Candidatus Pacebacteria bacterium]|nr:hypothetical protein [Candidatus Paceibacterota bacterium]
MDLLQESLNIHPPKFLSNFGRHPDFPGDFAARMAKAKEYFAKGDFEKGTEILEGKKLDLDKLRNPLHPLTYIIPSNEHICMADLEDPMGYVWLPFSSTDFYVEIDEEGIYHDLCNESAFLRLFGISQLGYLVSPRPQDLPNGECIYYLKPQFHHTRGTHSLQVAILMDVILARNGFKERAPRILAAGCHDIGTPAGGDSVKRADPKNLDEEANFSYVMQRRGLARKWRKKYGFCLAEAQRMVNGFGPYGHLLDIIDKIAYTAVDCMYVGRERPEKIMNFCLKHPLVMDVWQDIKYSPEHGFVFSDPERMYDFLLLRAYEFQEFLYNPYSRGMDLYLKSKVQPLYDKGILTKEQLLRLTDFQLEGILDQHYHDEEHYIVPDNLPCRKCQTQKEQDEFVEEISNGPGYIIDHTEHLTGFTSGLDWKLEGGSLLREALLKDKVELLEETVNSTKGYYVYYRSDNGRVS